MQISHEQAWRVKSSCNHAAFGGATARHSISMNARGQVFAATDNATRVPAEASVYALLKGFQYAD